MGHLTMTRLHLLLAIASAKRAGFDAFAAALTQLYHLQYPKK